MAVIQMSPNKTPRELSWECAPALHFSVTFIVIQIGNNITLSTPIYITPSHIKENNQSWLFSNINVIWSFVVFKTQNYFHDTES